MALHNDYKPISDESKLELPEYIDQPDYIRKKGTGYGLIAIGWLAWMWLFLPLLTAVFWWFQGKTIYQQMVIQAGPNSPLSLVNMAVMIAVFISLLLLWASYNWIRFSGNERRKAPQDLSKQQLAESFKVGIQDIQIMHTAKRVTLYYDDQGKLGRYEISH
ncbi:poly-beta-1,6-N-acetyl-D-glucosamine biosynthesis protein PgaD [Acinetobacter sp. WZC-1]|uniref:poly-beta-1,6-N-acetyl-D-glucosamine biosynthesis protein PgaD n=1 Tax=Acinetobacter sp. WZC-1 TaxID=3459034 RepID=UPI00403DF573